MSQSFIGRVIASHGRHYVARDNQGALWHCIARGKKHVVAVNDLVALTDLGNSGDITQPQAVIENQNVFNVLMDAVRVCSLGQITNALFEVGGQYRRNM